MNQTSLILQMCAYEKDCTERVNHFLKVYAFARTIGQGEGLAPELQELLETAAIVHDIGIRTSLEKYGSAAGEYQEKEGPAIAREMLAQLDYPEPVVERVCYLVGHHHTYSNMDGIDYQILVEADFLVNIFEGDMKREAVEEVQRSIFQTKTGTNLLKTLYL